MGALILDSGMDVGGWTPGNMVSGIRPPSPMRPRCACAVLAAAIRVRASRMRFIVVIMRLMAVMACWVIGIWARQRRRQASPFGRIPGSHDVDNSTTSRDPMSGFSTAIVGLLEIRSWLAMISDGRVAVDGSRRFVCAESHDLV